MSCTEHKHLLILASKSRLISKKTLAKQEKFTIYTKSAMTKSMAQFLYSTIMGVAKWERDLWWLSLFCGREVGTIFTIF